MTCWKWDGTIDFEVIRLDDEGTLGGNFRSTKDFITNPLKMTHIYQPVMLIELLENAGAATETGARLFLVMTDHRSITTSTLRFGG